MTNYPMLFESIVLSPWGGNLRRSDPLKMGDADTLAILNEKLSGRNGHNAKFALSLALKKIALEKEGTAIHGILIELDEQLWKAKKYNEVCQILEKTKTIFEDLGIPIV